jgi:general secretion pathway protein F
MKFQVKALRDPEGVVSILLDAADEADAERRAQASGLAVLSLRRAVAWNLDLFKRRSHFPLASFAQELLALLEAGLTLVESIEALAEKESHGPTRATLEHLTTQLRQGRTLPRCLSPACGLPRRPATCPMRSGATWATRHRWNWYARKS